MNEIYGIPGLYPTGCWCHTCRPIDYNDPGQKGRIYGGGING